MKHSSVVDKDVGAFVSLARSQQLLKVNMVSFFLWLSAADQVHSLAKFFSLSSLIRGKPFSHPVVDCRKARGTTF